MYSTRCTSYNHILLTQGGELSAASRTIALYKLLPSVECVSPRYLQATKQLKGKNVSDYTYHSDIVCAYIIANCVPMDKAMFRSPPYQRVYQYLRRCIQRMSLDRFSYQPGCVEGSTANCLEIMLRLGRKCTCVHCIMYALLQ